MYRAAPPPKTHETPSKTSAPAQANMFAALRVARAPLRLSAARTPSAPRTPARTLAAPATKKKKKKGGDNPGENDSKDDAYAFYKGVVDAPKRSRPRLPAKEAARNFEIGREYNRKARAKHDVFEAGLQTKLDLQQWAVASLPIDLRARAKTLDDVPLPPLDRRYWSLTPPIPGFAPEDHDKDE